MIMSVHPAGNNWRSVCTGLRAVTVVAAAVAIVPIRAVG
jgi:hypothetical protein